MSNYAHQARQTRQSLSYKIHPTTIKLLKKGHPWVLKDRFTENFPVRDKFIIAKDGQRPIALFIHDPSHKDIKARVWMLSGNFQQGIKNFKSELVKRINQAIIKRKKLKIWESRQNFYLVFGEADFLPGLHIQYLAGQILIQYYSRFWEQYQDYLIEQLLKLLNQNFLSALEYGNRKDEREEDDDVLDDCEFLRTDLWLQKRADGHSGQEPPLSMDPNLAHKKLQVDEFGVEYVVELGKRYDYGLYTDMSSIRDYLRPVFKASKSVLNLYSYTGAFSLFALKEGATRVTSVDLSEKYIEILENNIALNSKLGIPDKMHQSLIMSSEQALEKLVSEEAKFELIISDPPSSSSDGNKRTNALQSYQNELPLMASLMSEDARLCLFLNTRSLGRQKFENKIKEIIDKNRLGLKIEKRLFMSQDCPRLKGFPEGDYLKGLVLVHDRS